MKTSIEIDEKLLGEVRSILGTATIKDTVEESLRFVVRQRALQEVVDLFGTVELDLTTEKLRQMRNKRTRNATFRSFTAIRTSN